MGHSSNVWFPVLAIAFALVLIFKGNWRKTLAEQVAEAIERFRGGGPPTPMHPSPAGDDALLRRPGGKTSK